MASSAYVAQIGDPQAPIRSLDLCVELMLVQGDYVLAKALRPAGDIPPGTVGFFFSDTLASPVNPLVPANPADPHWYWSSLFPAYNPALNWLDLVTAEEVCSRYLALDDAVVVYYLMS